MTILELLQSFDSDICYNNTVAFVLSANSVKAQDTSDYWGITYQPMTELTPTSMYFGNATDEALNYEEVARHQVLTNISSVEGFRLAFSKICKNAESDKIFLVSPNTQGWLKRSLDLFKDLDIVPKDKEVFTLNVSGDSMINAGILDGDIVIVERRNTARNGEIVVAMTEENEVIRFRDRFCLNK